MLVLTAATVRDDAPPVPREKRVVFMRQRKSRYDFFFWSQKHSRSTNRRNPRDSKSLSSYTLYWRRVFSNSKLAGLSTTTCTKKK